MAAEANVGFDPWQQIHFGRDVLTWMQRMTGAQHPHTWQKAYCTNSLCTCTIICCCGPYDATHVVTSGQLLQMHTGWSITRLSIELW